MNTLTLFEEPRPCTMFMFGTEPCRPSMLVACRSFMSSSLKALTATGTSWMDSARRRAVTVTLSSVLAAEPSAGLAVWASCACAMPATSERPMARLR